jgi:hypothetical protein
MSSSSAACAASQQLLNLEQQQALVERLQHAEQVMQILHGDLQASLQQQQQLAQQLEQSRAAQEQAQQQHQVLQQQQQQQQQQQECSQPEADTVSREQHEQVLEQLNDARQQLDDAQQLLAQAQEAARLAYRQQAELQMQMEQQAADAAAREAELQQFSEQLQQQLEVALQSNSTSAGQQLQVVAEISHRRSAGATGDLTPDGVVSQAGWQAYTARTVAAETSGVLRNSSTSSSTIQASTTPAESDAAMQSHGCTLTLDQQQLFKDHQLSDELPEHQQQPQQQDVQPCSHCRQLEQQVERLQHLLQHAAAGPGSDIEPELTAAAANREADSQDRRNTGAATSRQHRPAALHVKQQRAQRGLPMKTWMCPVAPELAALQASAAAQQRPLSARERGTVAYASLWHMQAASDAGHADADYTAQVPEALMLAGVRKMRPLSYSPPQAAGINSSMPTDGLSGTAMTSRTTAQAAIRSSRQQADGLSVGAERLLQEGLLAGQFEKQQRQQAFLQLIGDASKPGASASQAAGINATTVAGAALVPQLAEQQPVFSAVRWACRGSSPRRGSPRQLTPRSARPASAAANICEAGAQGSMLAHTYGRPQTARTHTVTAGSSGSDMISKLHQPAVAELAASIAGSVHRGQPDPSPSEVAAHAQLTLASRRSMLRAGSAPLRSGAVPKLNLSVLSS